MYVHTHTQCSGPQSPVKPSPAARYHPSAKRSPGSAWDLMSFAQPAVSRFLAPRCEWRFEWDISTSIWGLYIDISIRNI